MRTRRMKMMMIVNFMQTRYNMYLIVVFPVFFSLFSLDLII